MTSAKRSSSVIFASVARARASIDASSAGLNGVAVVGGTAGAVVAPGVAGSGDPLQPVHVAMTNKAHRRREQVARIDRCVAIIAIPPALMARSYRQSHLRAHRHTALSSRRVPRHFFLLASATLFRGRARSSFP